MRGEWRKQEWRICENKGEKIECKKKLKKDKTEGKKGKTGRIVTKRKENNERKLQEEKG